MDDYAESLHISTNWFIRNFKQYMKISPAQYILSLRMVNAQSLLENTEYNIGEIAEIVGYDNPLYFSRVFKKEYGVSPAQYRKNLEESTEKWEGFLINKESRTMSIKNAIHSQQVYDPTDDSIMAEQELCMERLYDYNHTRPSEHAKREIGRASCRERV